MNQRNRRALAAILATLFVLVTMSAAAQTGAAAPVSSADLPITRLALFTSGVGYFEHVGVVTGDQELVLTVPKDEMDDLLQSLVLQDFGGGTIEPVRYSSQAPLSRLLDAFSIDLSNNVTLVGLLAQARGEQVRLDGPSVIEGALLGVEEQRDAEGRARAFVTVATATGVRRVALDEVGAVQFLDPAVAAQIDEALATIAANRDDESATVTLRFSGEGQREVRVGYVREMPIWKSTYRLVVGDDGRGTLQGWAIVDNPTDQVLEGVQLSFIAGQPISFITSLYEPVWAVRPRVAVKATGGLVPGTDSGQSILGSAANLGRDASAEASFMDVMPAPVAAAPQMSGAGVVGQAQASATATAFAYHVLEPVTIGRNESALVPIVVAEVTAERVSLFDQSNHARHPLHALRLVNDTGLQLAAGTVTIFDEVGFAGNAQLPELLPADERLLAYAVDLELSVSLQSGARTSDVTRATIRGNVIEVTALTRQTLNIEVSGNPADGRFLIVQGPALTGFDIVEPQPEPPMSAGRPRFGVAVVGQDGATPEDSAVPTHLVCRPDAPCELEVVAERVDSQQLALTNLGSDVIALYLQNVELSEQDRATLTRIVDLQAQIASAQRASERTDAQVDVIFQEQQRIRANMAALDRNSDLYRRYVAELTAQEDDLAELRDLQTQQGDELEALRAALNQLVSRLGD
ncbi:MAG: hypothetical protein WDA03_01645 [Trueperaceae bacterium]